MKKKYYFLLTLLFLFSCSKKITVTTYSDALANILSESLKNEEPNFSKVAPLSSYTDEFNQRFEKLYTNQKFIIKINHHLSKKNFQKAQEELNQLIIKNGKNRFTSYAQKLFQNAEAIRDYRLSFPFEDKVENTRAIARLQTQTQEFKTNSIFALWFSKEKQQLKKLIKYENKLIQSNLRLYNDFFQTQRIKEFNTAFLLTAYALPNSQEAKLIHGQIPTTLENPLSEREWINLYASKNNSYEFLQRLNTLEPMTLSNLLTRIEYNLANNNKIEAYKYIKIILATKLVDHKVLKKIIQKKFHLSIPNSIISINNILNNIIKL